MTKLSKLFVSFVLILTLIGCTSKTEVNLTDVTFASFYLGSDKNPADFLRTPLRYKEAQVVESILDKTHWVSVYPDQNTLEPVGVLLYDTKGLRYELYQAVEMIVIKVTDRKKSAVYFQVEGNADSLINLRFKPLRQAIVNKQQFIQAGLTSANSQGTSAEATFELSTLQAETLKTLLQVDIWDVIEGIPTDSTAQLDMSITNSDGSKLIFYTGVTEAFVSCLVSISGKSEVFVYRIQPSIHDAIKTSLISWGITVQDPVNKPDLDHVVFTEVMYALTYVTSSILEPAFFTITEAESNKAKGSLRISDWVRLNKNPEFSEVLMTLKDTEGYVYTIGGSSFGAVVQITRPTEPNYFLNYSITDSQTLLGYDFIHYWEAALATDAMKAFLPTEMSILDGQIGESATYRKVSLSVSGAKVLIEHLELSTWAFDPEPWKYAFGWEPTYVLRDDKGNSFSIYSYFTHDIMAIVVRTPSTPAEDWIWYFTSNTVFNDLKTYINDQYPNP